MFSGTMYRMLTGDMHRMHTGNMHRMHTGNMHRMHTGDMYHRMTSIGASFFAPMRIALGPRRISACSPWWSRLPRGAPHGDWRLHQFLRD